MYMSKLIIKKGSHTVTFSELRRGAGERKRRREKNAREERQRETGDKTETHCGGVYAQILLI